MKFEEIKNLTAWELLTLLQNMVKENSEKIKNLSQLSLIKENKNRTAEEKITNINSEKPDAFKKAYEQNSKYIELHHKLFSFLKELNEDLSDSETQNAQRNTELEEIEKIKEFEFQFCLEETIKGTILFNSAHPFFDNKEFISSLINEYSGIEEYEKCAELLKRINELQ